MNDSVLISVCIIWDELDQSYFNEISTFIDRFEKHFKIYEILLILEDKNILDSNLEKILRNVKNVRIFSVRNKCDHYRKRSILAKESIGDIIALTTPDELTSFDLIKMIELSAENHSICLGKHTKLSFLDRIFAWPLLMLGKSSGIYSDIYNSKSTVLPRSYLNEILTFQDTDLMLRFYPLEMGFNLDFVEAKDYSTRRLNDLQSKIKLAFKILSTLSPRILKLTSLISGISTLISVSYLMYVLIVWLTLSNIQPGWTTISIIVSLSTFFISLTIFGLSLGLQHLLTNVLIRNDRELVNIVEDKNIYKNLKNDLNVEEFDKK